MLNQINLIGSLGKDPESMFFPNGDQQATVTIATSKRWKDKQTNERKEKTTWHNLVFNRGLAKVASEYLKKGSKIFVSGEIDNQSWDKDGQKHYKTVVLVNEMHMLDGKPAGSGDNRAAQQASAYQAPKQSSAPEPDYSHQTAPPAGYDDFDSYIPFN